jgi:HTH-type transcriptional regulator/antitoxin HigA
VLPGMEATAESILMTKSPGTYIREELKSRGWSQTQLAEIIDRPIQAINEIVQGKKAITPDTAAALGVALGPDAVTWLNRESEYRLSLLDADAAGVARRVRLYDLAPIREMEKRQWIRPTKGANELEQELIRFFGVANIDEEPRIVAAMRRSSEGDVPLTASQRAWCFRVKQLGASLMAAEYQEEQLPKLEELLRKLAAHPQEAHKLPQTLANFGIRLLIVEPLTGSKVDGVALWLDKRSPIIGMSARYDRVDNFWFTLFHELSHIRHRDKPHLDSDLSGEQLLEVRSPIEERADAEAAAGLIPKKDMDSFVRRVGPLYSKDRINRFANRMKIHPGIIVGQLQKRGEIGWGANREMLAKIRQYIIPAAVTDGFGYSIDPRKVG